NYRAYWESHYAAGGTSGAGSYGILAEFKAEVINKFLEDNGIETVIEFGCGDGNQLGYMKYKKYLGFDISRAALKRCVAKFGQDPTKRFQLYDPRLFVNNGEYKADLVVCLDVLYHITDENDYRKTLADILSCAWKYVILYTTWREAASNNPTIVHRDLLTYLKPYADFKVVKIIPQKYPHLSCAEFIILSRA
ncbi:MAG: class I SAM-dependent methyltransferase, partial [Bacillota bacterium]